MNKEEVIQTIKTAGTEFGRVMACLQGPEYVAGYYQAVNDMVRLFEYAPLKPDFDAERAEMQRLVSVLAEEKKSLKKTLRERDAIIEKLLKHVDICEVLGIEVAKR